MFFYLLDQEMSSDVNVAAAALVIALLVGVGLVAFVLLFLCLWYKTRKEIEILSELMPA